ncbi:Imm50 family immunity protein [Clostridium sp. CMCC3677]|uniref:Imm50 family immunity protein n=2 Tax=Clostridium TaxID=1485 RepID=UPI00338F460D
MFTWYDCLDNNKFLITLYNSVPMLGEVQITKLAISDSGNRITIAFKMPFYPESPPKKWKERNYNSAMLELDFFAISMLNINANTNYYIGNIEIKRTENQLIDITISGNINVQFQAESGLIQSVEGYILRSE